MKTIQITLLSLACGLAIAQQVQPPKTAPASAVAPLDEVASQSKETRRQIMRETLNRQYTGAEIEEYRRAIDAYDRSKSGAYTEAGKVVKRRVPVGLGPEAPVEEIRLNAQSNSSIVFTDAQGYPWNVEDIIVPGFLTAKKVGNIVILMPSASGSVRFARANATVLLEGLNSTLPFTISFGYSREVDGQFEVQVQARNPRAPINAVRGGAIEADEYFGLFLDGEPPNDAQRIKTSAKNVDAWIYAGKLYVRTPLALHSPAFKMFGSSASGMNVYRFDQVPSVINAIESGAIVSIGIGSE